MAKKKLVLMAIALSIIVLGCVNPYSTIHTKEKEIHYLNGNDNNDDAFISIFSDDDNEFIEPEIITEPEEPETGIIIPETEPEEPKQSVIKYLFDDDNIKTFAVRDFLIPIINAGISGNANNDYYINKDTGEKLFFWGNNFAYYKNINDKNPTIQKGYTASTQDKNYIIFATELKYNGTSIQTDKEIDGIKVSLNTGILCFYLNGNKWEYCK